MAWEDCGAATSQPLVAAGFQKSSELWTLPPLVCRPTRSGQGGPPDWHLPCGRRVNKREVGLLVLLGGFLVAGDQVLELRAALQGFEGGAAAQEQLAVPAARIQGGLQDAERLRAGCRCGRKGSCASNRAPCAARGTVRPPGSPGRARPGILHRGTAPEAGCKARRKWNVPYRCGLFYRIFRPAQGWGKDLERDLGRLFQADLEQSQREGSEMGEGEILVGVFDGREERAGLVEVPAGQAGGGAHQQTADQPGSASSRRRGRIRPGTGRPSRGRNAARGPEPAGFERQGRRRRRRGRYSTCRPVSAQAEGFDGLAHPERKTAGSPRSMGGRKAGAGTGKGAGDDGGVSGQQVWQAGLQLPGIRAAQAR